MAVLSFPISLPTKPQWICHGSHHPVFPVVVGAMKQQHHARRRRRDGASDVRAATSDDGWKLSFSFPVRGQKLQDNHHHRRQQVVTMVVVEGAAGDGVVIRPGPTPFLFSVLERLRSLRKSPTQVGGCHKLCSTLSGT